MAHTPSQNAVFRGESADQGADGPPGFDLASRIQSALSAADFHPSDCDNWRDCGWSMRVPINGAEIEVALSLSGKSDSWMLQIACASDPGLLARLFGKRFVDRREDVFAVAMAVHRELIRLGLRDIRWRTDGDPELDGSTPSPQRPTLAGR